MKQKELWIIITFLSLLCLGMIDNGRGPSYPFILNEFKITQDFGSLFFALTSFTGLMVNLTTFSWLPKLGAFSSLKISLLLIALASFLIGLSGHVVNHDGGLALVILYLGSLILGPGAAGLSVSMNILIPKLIEKEKVRKYLSGLHFMFGVSSLLSPFIMLLIEKILEGWKNYFLLFSAPPFMLFFLGRGEKDKAFEMPSKKMTAPALPFAYRCLFGFTLASYVASEVLVSTRISLLLQNVHHASSESAKLAFALFSLGLLAGRLIFALINTKISTFKLLFISLLATTALYIPSFTINPFLFAITGFSMSFFYPCFIAWLNEEFKNDNEYMLSFTLICVGVLLVSMHWGFGLISARIGIARAFYLAPFFTLTSFVLLIAGNIILKKEKHL